MVTACNLPFSYCLFLSKKALTLKTGVLLICHCWCFLVVLQSFCLPMTQLSLVCTFIGGIPIIQVIRDKMSGIWRKGLCPKPLVSRITVCDSIWFTGIKSWQITISEDQRLLHNHPLVETVRSYVCPSNCWSGTCLIANNLLAGPQLNYWVSESTKLLDVGLA